MCECGYGHADSGPVLLRAESDGDGSGDREGLAAGLSLPADGARHQEPGRMGERLFLFMELNLSYKNFSAILFS